MKLKQSIYLSIQRLPVSVPCSAYADRRVRCASGPPGVHPGPLPAGHTPASRAGQPYGLPET